MHQFDLIPSDYREREQIRYRCKFFSLLFATVLLGVAGTKFALIQMFQGLQDEIEILQNAQNFNLHQQQKFNELLAQERLLTKRLEILDGIQGRVSAKQVFKAIDRVLDDHIWFTRWTFRRTIEVADLLPQSITANDIVIPEGDSGTNKSQICRLDTIMEINGQVLNHSKLALFVSNLIKQPEIADVKVLSTGLKQYTTTQAIDFKIAVTIHQ